MGDAAALVNVTWTEADLVGSCTDVAVTFPVVGVIEAESTPFAVILPIAALAVHVTPCVELVTSAVNV